ncbi:sulfate ABC transporter permease subunit CysT [Pseudogemmobacter blasticus]|uniref:Sulfate transport system permease protein CysT n=1 Tax=Fuscovulum blasticum DSM 2131 TaxID=1188250 RepID=A0A2T4J6Q5_FUSBL|nr:sulfate ABC transporter permease subunit CysT [Fuscovulum blasticum]AWD22882.1 sulfate ABC transporter permease subunit CysT [Fuscovulum blasticum]PTE13581.1 sulfate ABC transporter permease subunit CysT [Fuscovulum blasticum DSM 2131]
MGRPLLQRSPMPGLGLSMGITLTMLSIVVLLPIGALLLRGASFGLGNMWEVVNRPRVWSALFLSFRLSLLAAVFNLVFGVLLAWVLVRYRFPGRRILDAAVDLPFALPTAVAGIALTALYAPNGAFGSLAREVGVKIAYTQWGILIALIFVGLPFVARTVQPVIEEIEREVEEASATLGASRFYTLRHVILPMLAPAALTGFALALARAVGEYGSVIFIAGNIPLLTEIAPLLIVIQLEEFNYDGAAAIGIAMLLISFAMLLAINLIQIWSRRRIGHV